MSKFQKGQGQISKFGLSGPYPSHSEHSWQNVTQSSVSQHGHTRIVRAVFGLIQISWPTCGQVASWLHVYVLLVNINKTCQSTKSHYYILSSRT